MSAIFSFCKRYFLLLFSLLVILLLLWGKENRATSTQEIGMMGSPSYSYEESSRKESPDYEDMMMDEDTKTSSSQAENKIIKTASLGIKVEDVRVSVDEVKNLVEGMEGEVQYSTVNFYDYLNAYSANMTLKVPSDRLDEAMKGIKELALVLNNESLGSQDITESYLDVQARLNNLRAEEAQYVEILNRAATVAEVLQVTQQLSRVRYEIESAESTLKYYDEQVDYSFITLTLNEESKLSAVSERWQPGQDAENAFRDWVGFLQGLLSSIIYAVIFLWPVILVVVLAWIFYRKRK